MARTPTRLAGPALIDSTAETIYTVPGSTIAVIKNVVITNDTGSAVDVTLAVGDATVQANRFMDALSIPVGQTNLFFYIPLVAAETLRAFAATDDTTTITVGGDEYDA